MSFLNPIFLFALLTVAVPLLIYLLNLRKPKKIRFSTLAFFDALKSTSLKRIKIKRWLLLAVRCLAIIALALALSRPFLPPEFGWLSDNEPKIIGILVDNSPSMERIDRNGPYIDQAVALAEEFISMSGNDDMFLLNGTNGESLNLPVLSGRAAQRQLGSLDVNNAGNYLAERLRSMASSLADARQPNKVIYLITDGQQSQFENVEEHLGEFDDVNLQIMKLGRGETSNIGFENVELEYGGRDGAGNLQIRTTIRNYSSQPVSNKFVSLLIDEELITQHTFGIEAHSAAEYIFEVPVSGGQSIPAELVLEGDELTFDNRYYAAIQLPETRTILVLTDDASRRSFNSYLRPMLDIAAEESNRFNISTENISDVQISALFDYDAIIIDGARSIPDYLAQPLVDHVQSGAGVLLLPAAEGSLSSYNRLLNFAGAGSFENITGSYGSFNPVDRMATPTEGHPILDTIFDKQDDEEIRLNVPEVFYMFDMERRQRSSSVAILQTRTGKPLFTDTRVGNGNMIVSAIGSDPGWSNFPIKPFFAPFFFRALDYLAEGEGAVLNTHTLGGEFRASFGQNRQTVRIHRDDEVIIPGQSQTYRGTQISYPAIEWTPGWFTIEADDKTYLFSSNQDAMESQLNSLDVTELENMVTNHFRNVKVSVVDGDKTDILADLETASFGREIWYWFVLIAIILLLLESIISRYYKAETLE